MMLHASTRAHSQASSALAQSSRRVRKRFSTTSVVRRPASAPKGKSCVAWLYTQASSHFADHACAVRSSADGPSEAKASDPPSESSSAPRPPSSSSPSPSASTPSSASSTPSASTSCLFRPASLASSSSHGSSSVSSHRPISPPSRFFASSSIQLISSFCSLFSPPHRQLRHLHVQVQSVVHLLLLGDPSSRSP